MPLCFACPREGVTYISGQAEGLSKLSLLGENGVYTKLLTDPRLNQKLIYLCKSNILPLKIRLFLVFPRCHVILSFSPSLSSLNLNLHQPPARRTVPVVGKGVRRWLLLSCGRVLKCGASFAFLRRQGLQRRCLRLLRHKKVSAL